MPHQCVSCGKLYKDGSKEILTGCTSCNGRLFFFISKAKMERLTEGEKRIELSDKDKQQIEKDVREIVGNKVSPEDPIVLDIESIRIKKPGQYELDLVNLFKGEPLVFKLEEGKYMVDVIETFNKFVRKK